MPVNLMPAINKAFREFRRYTTDGFPSAPVSAPLPVGDPSSGIYNPAKSEIRDAFEDVQTAINAGLDDLVGSFETYRYIATSAQTVFTGADANSKTLSYVQGKVIVTVNGDTLAPNTYAASNGTSIVLGTARTSGDVVVIYSFGSFVVADVWTRAESDGRFAPAIHDHGDLYLNSGARFGMNTGAANNATAINTALADIASRGGGVLVMPPGTFQVEEPITGLDHVSMEGADKFQTILTVPQTTTAGGGLSNHPLMYVGKNGFTLRNFAVRGNRAAHPGAVPTTAFNCGYLEGCSHFKIEGMRFFDAENDALVLTRNAVIGGNSHFEISNSVFFNSKNLLNIFKGSIYGTVRRNVFDLARLNAIMVDDATAADTTPVTAFQNVGINVTENTITRWSQQSGAAANGIMYTGAIQGSVVSNILRNGGIVGVDAPSSSAAVGILINSGENRHNSAIGVSVIGNQIDGVAGGGGISLSGAWNVSVIGNTLRNLFLWPTSLIGSAINLTPDLSGLSAQKNTLGCTVVGNTIEGNNNTAYGVQLGADTAANLIGPNAMRALNIQDYIVSDTAGQGQIRSPMYAAALPIFTAGMRGQVMHNSADDVAYFATNTRWKPLSIPSGALPTWTAAQRGDVRHNTADDKLYVATSSAWVVVGTQT